MVIKGSMRAALLGGLMACATLAYAAVRDSVMFTNVTPTQTSNYAAGTIRLHTFTSTGYTLGRITFGGNLQEINGTTNDFGTDNKVRVTFPDGRFKDVQLSSVAGYTGVLNFNGAFFLAAGSVPPFGGDWTFAFINSFDDAPTGGTPDVRINSITFNLTDELPTPPSSTNLGTIGSPRSIGNSTVLSAGQVGWFQFRVGEATTGSKYFDIDTEGTTGFIGVGTPNDTVIALFNEFGELIALDDDDGSDSRSQLTFGPSAGSRAGFGNGLVYNGRDGTLQAGITYYLVVCGFAGTFTDGFNAASDSQLAGPVFLNFRTNVIPPTMVSGEVELQDLATVPTGRLVTIEVRPAGSTVPVATAVVALTVSGNYSASLGMVLAPGSYDVTAKGAHWLRGKVASVAFTSAGATGVDFSLLNGDCDGDNEVAIGDYSLLSSSFGDCLGDPGYDALADLNGDDCVDIGDFAILSANFGLLGED